MTETPAESPPPKSDMMATLRKFVFVMGVLALFVLLFGKLVPHLLLQSEPPPADTPITVTRETPAPAEKPDAVKEQIERLEARLKTFEEVIVAPTPEPAPQPAMPPATGNEIPLPETVSPPAEQERLARLEAQLSEQTEALAAVKAQLSEARAGAERNRVMLTAFASMKEALTRGDAFQRELSRIEALTADDPQWQERIEALSPFAGGIVTLAELRQGFEAAVPRALAPGEESSWLASSLYSLVRIRRVGESAGEGDEAAIARAEARLSRGDVGVALSALEKLSPRGVSAFAEWRGQAQEYVEARRAMEALQTALMPGHD